VSGTELHIPDTGLMEDAPPREERERAENPRDAMMRQIAANYEQKTRGDEIAYGEQLLQDARDRAPHEEDTGEGAEVVDPSAGAPSAASHQPAADLTPPAPSPVATPEPQPTHQAAPVAPQLRAVNVQGQQLWVTEEQFERLATIGAVANMALHQQQAPQQAPAPVAPPPTAAPRLDRERAQQFVQRLTYGSPDDGAAALLELAETLQAPAQPQIDQQQIIQAASQHAYHQIRLENDLQTIGREFPEVFNDQTRAITAAVHLSQIRQRDAATGQSRLPIDQYREAASLVRNAFAPPSQSQPGGNGPSPALQAAPDPNRLERKRAAPRNPVGVSRAANLGEPERAHPTNSQIVDQLRRARHQPPLN